MAGSSSSSLIVTHGYVCTVCKTEIADAPSFVAHLPKGYPEGYNMLFDEKIKNVTRREGNKSCPYASKPRHLHLVELRCSNCNTLLGNRILHATGYEDLALNSGWVILCEKGIEARPKDEPVTE